MPFFCIGYSKELFFTLSGNSNTGAKSGAMWNKQKCIMCEYVNITLF